MRSIGPLNLGSYNKSGYLHSHHFKVNFHTINTKKTSFLDFLVY